MLTTQQYVMLLLVHKISIYNLATGRFNTAISQNSSTAITTGDYNVTIGKMQVVVVMALLPATTI